MLINKRHIGLFRVVKNHQRCLQNNKWGRAKKAKPKRLYYSPKFNRVPINFQLF